MDWYYKNVPDKARLGQEGDLYRRQGNLPYCHSVSTTVPMLFLSYGNWDLTCKMSPTPRVHTGKVQSYHWPLGPYARLYMYQVD